MKEDPIYFIDTETTGLSSKRHEITEICILKRQPGEVDRQWTWRVNPEHLYTASVYALNLNGFDFELWAETGLSQAEAAKECAEILQAPGIIVAHNAQFDLKFLRSMMHQQNQPFSFPDSVVCTRSLSDQLKIITGWKSSSMDSIRGYLGWSTEGAHTASKDVDDLAKLYDYLIGLISDRANL
tara:strand:- start:619 stop:1167 length:549 start_codon:yes stop_codon:yes gene_type:complete